MILKKYKQLLKQKNDLLKGLTTSEGQDFDSKMLDFTQNYIEMPLQAQKDSFSIIFDADFLNFVLKRLFKAKAGGKTEFFCIFLVTEYLKHRPQFFKTKIGNLVKYAQSQAISFK